MEEDDVLNKITVGALDHHLALKEKASKWTTDSEMYEESIKACVTKSHNHLLKKPTDSRFG